jgi:CDP-diacylglycerol--glycerol-3-phosphate 3-phosphatidyltransferase
MNVPHAPGVDAVGRFLTFANLLSIARILLVIPFALVMLSAHPHARVWGAVIMAIAAATDKFDGVVARRRGETTRWGHILDPLADKIAAGGVLVVLLILG